MDKIALIGLGAACALAAPVVAKAGRAIHESPYGPAVESVVAIVVIASVFSPTMGLWQLAFF